jgi:ERCC4-type nuclease
MILISPSEPAELRQMLKAVNSPLCEKLGCDVLAPTKKGLLGVQRKEASDFIASLEDGRLAKQLPLLVNNTALPVLLLEGSFHFNVENHLQFGTRATRYTKQGIHNLIRSAVYCNGVSVEYSADLADTPVIIGELIDFINREHKSLLKRPKLQGVWGKPTPVEALGYFYQGIDSVGVVLSQALMKKYPCPTDLINASFNDLQALPQIGKQRAEKIFTFLHKEHQDGDSNKN